MLCNYLNNIYKQYIHPQLLDEEFIYSKLLDETFFDTWSQVDSIIKIDIISNSQFYMKSNIILFEKFESSFYAGEYVLYFNHNYIETKIFEKLQLNRLLWNGELTLYVTNIMKSCIQDLRYVTFSNFKQEQKEYNQQFK